jgi:hypothetical protein
MQQSPLFLKSFETLTWILNHTRKFPKHQRFVLAKRIEEAALNFHDNLVWATKNNSTSNSLREADYHLERLRIYNRLCVQLQLHSMKQYEYLAAALDEMGRLLGGWIQKKSGNFKGRA